MTTFHLYTSQKTYTKRFNKFNESKVKYITSPKHSNFGVVSSPDTPGKQKEGLVFLVTWGRAYGIKNVKMTLYTWDSSCLTT